MPQNRFMDDIARLVTDATGAAQGVRREAETAVRGVVERFLRDMDIPTREEVEVLRELIAAVRQDNERLTARLAVLEGDTKVSAGPAVESQM